MNRTLELRHSRLGFEVTIPDGWERMEDSLDTALIVAEPMVDPRRFRPNLVVTIDNLPAAITPGQWHAQSVQTLIQQLNGFHLIDIGDTNVDGRVERRTLGSHATEAGPVMMEQWLRFGSATCYTLTASVGTVEYTEYRDLFRSIASSLRLPEEPE